MRGNGLGSATIYGSSTFPDEGFSYDRMYFQLDISTRLIELFTNFTSQTRSITSRWLIPDQIPMAVNSSYAAPMHPIWMESMLYSEGLLKDLRL